MKADVHTGTLPLEDDYWTERMQLFTAQFPTYYTKPQIVWSRFHISEERFEASKHEITPITEKKGMRTYVMMQPYVLEPIRTFTVGLYNSPKHYADQESAIGRTIGQHKQEGYWEVQMGNAQAWYYHTDKIIILWECFFDQRFHMHPFATDANMRQLWTGFEQWLLQQFPKATTLATPFNDPIAESIDEYQSFLKMLGYSPIAEAAFGKSV
jgi:hypothetical protein